MDRERTLEKLDNIIQHLTSGWNLCNVQRDISWKHPLKKIVYKGIYFIDDKICKSAYQRQSEYNMNLLSAIQELRDILQEDDVMEQVILCEDNFVKDNNILDLLLVFQIYVQKKNPDAQLYLAPQSISSEAYLQAILDEIEELGIRNVHFLLYQKEEDREKLRRKADISISLKNYSRNELGDVNKILSQLEKV